MAATADNRLIEALPEVDEAALDAPEGAGLFGTIRNKIIVPFLLLTLIVTMLGTFVVTRLVAANAQDRLTNQLLETSRAASDSIVDREQTQLDVLRLVVFTRGIPEALASRDAAGLDTGLVALAANQDAYMLFSLDPQGSVITAVRQAATGYDTGLLGGTALGDIPAVQSVVDEELDERGDKFASVAVIGSDTLFLTTAPVRDEGGDLVGIVMMGTPLSEVLSDTKTDVLADLTFYQEGGSLATTFVVVGDSTADLDIAPETYDAAVNADESTPLLTTQVNEREFQTAFVPLIIRGRSLGVVGVSWPSTFVTSLITTNRNGLSVMFSLIAVLVVVIGYIVAQQLSAPIRRLANTAQAVSAGDLEQQSGVRTSDEIGVLGRIFDAMTMRLAAQAQALLRAFREKEREAAYLSAVIASTVDGTVVLDRRGEITRINPAAREVLQLDRGMWLSLLDRLAERAAYGEPVKERIELVNQWIDAIAAPVITSSGDQAGTVITLRDVTDQVLTERMRTSFIMQMSHELYTPLTSIKGYIDLAVMLLGEDHQRIRDLLAKSTDSSIVLNRMISQMLDVSGMIRGGFEVRPSAVHLSHLVREAVDAHHVIYKNKKLHLEVRIDESMPSYDGDGDRLKWAFGQMIKNAGDYTMEGGWVTVSLSQDPDWVTFRVTDTGVGITDRDRPRIFDLFYRGYAVAPDGTVVDERGTGAGLFIVREVVRAHGGHVDVLSKVGVGSEFIIRLPVTDERETGTQRYD